jgi:hypothetical protein
MRLTISAVSRKSDCDRDVMRSVLSRHSLGVERISDMQKSFAGSCVTRLHAISRATLCA